MPISLFSLQLRLALFLFCQQCAWASLPLVAPFGNDFLTGYFFSPRSHSASPPPSTPPPVSTGIVSFFSFFFSLPLPSLLFFFQSACFPFELFFYLYVLSFPSCLRHGLQTTLDISGSYCFFQYRPPPSPVRVFSFFFKAREARFF